MSIAGSIFLVAVGAILRYALNIQWDVVNLETVGLILMVAGVLGLALSFAYVAMADRSRRGPGPYEDETRRMRR